MSTLTALLERGRGLRPRRSVGTNDDGVDELSICLSICLSLRLFLSPLSA